CLCIHLLYSVILTLTTLTTFPYTTLFRSSFCVILFMKYFIIILSAFYLILCNKAQAQLYFLGDKKAMQENKGIAKTRSQSPELTTIIKNAEIVLNKREVSVAEKKLLPASKNRNDYYSLATYWWPDVNKGKDA